jgi:hypothetical protein
MRESKTPTETVKPKETRYFSFQNHFNNKREKKTERSEKIKETETEKKGKRKRKLEVDKNVPVPVKDVADDVVEKSKSDKTDFIPYYERYFEASPLLKELLELTKPMLRYEVYKLLFDLLIILSTDLLNYRLFYF